MTRESCLLVCWEVVRWVCGELISGDADCHIILALIGIICAGRDGAVIASPSTTLDAHIGADRVIYRTVMCGDVDVVIWDLIHNVVHWVLGAAARDLDCIHSASIEVAVLDITEAAGIGTTGDLDGHLASVC